MQTCTATVEATPKAKTEATSKVVAVAMSEAVGGIMVQIIPMATGAILEASYEDTEVGEIEAAEAMSNITNMETPQTIEEARDTPRPSATISAIPTGPA